MKFSFTVVLFSCILRFSFLNFLLVGLCQSERTGHGISNQSDSPNIEEVDLVSFLTLKSQKHDSVFAQALHLLDSLKASPSCNRLAATRLVTSCHSIRDNADDAFSDAHMRLERVKALYAARLAICEIHGAGTAIPSPCSPVSMLPQQKGFFGFATKSSSQINVVESLGIESLESCLKALESRPQWWTSYSNSRQNAMIICQAARIETEKDELLELHKSLVQGTVQLSDALQDALRKAAAESSHHKAFMDAVDAMHARLISELEENEFQLKRSLTNALDATESIIDAVVTGATSILSQISREAHSLEYSIRNATDHAGSLQHSLHAIHEEISARNEEMKIAHRRDAQASLEVSVALRSSLESLLQGDLSRLFQGMETLDASLEWLAARLKVVLHQETTVSERLRSFEMLLNESERRAIELYKLQLRQAEALAAQSQAQESLQLNMQVTQALLDKASATAADMQVTIDDSLVHLRESSFVYGNLGRHSLWTLCAVFTTIFSVQNSRLGVALLLILGVAISL